MTQVIKILFHSVVMSLVASHLPGQVPCDDIQLPQEQVTLHLDRNICLAGETIWFKAWCFLNDGLEEELSKVLYVEIFDASQKVIVQEKYLLDNNKTEGSFRIPEDVVSQHYFLRAYTRYMRNFSTDHFHYQQLTIINPFIEGGSVESAQIEKKGSDSKPSTQSLANLTANQNLQIQLEKEKYQARELITIDINSSKPISADLSAVVRMQGLGSQMQQHVMEQLSEQTESDKSNPLSSEQLKWFPETRGLTISGVVQDENEESVAGALSMVAVLQKRPLLYMGTTDADGAFSICLHHLQDQKDLFVGTPNENNKVLIRNDFETNFSEISLEPLQYDSSLHAMVEALYLHQQLVNTYPQQKAQTVFLPSQPNAIATNILSPDRRIVLDNFIKMKTMSEVFTEITTGVQLRKKGGVQSLVVFNSEQQKLYDAPLVLLDNVPVFDIPELLKVDPAKIESIEIYNTDYYLGDYTAGGIISITSKTDNFAAYQWGDQASFTRFKNFAITQPFAQVVHESKNANPDFRSVLYWQPELQLTKQKTKTSFSIYAPDRPGLYEVVVQGFTESGENCLGYVTFEVK